MSSRIRDDVRQLYLCFCEVAQPEGPGQPAWIIQKYPDDFDDDELKSVPMFVYPCEFDRSTIQHFSFVRTDIKSKFTFGYCRHDPKTSTALVFLSLLPWQEVFVRALDKTADIIRTCEAVDLTQFLKLLYNTQLPEPGTEISVRANEKIGSFHCTTPQPFELQLPSIPGNRNLTEYYNAVDPICMIAILAALLNERRIIMKSRKLPRLSACVQAANTLIYPMNWQHIFIPIIPNTRGVIETIFAPMPYLIGVPTETWEAVNSPDVGDVVVLDLDARVNQLESKFNDVENMPADVVRFLKTQLRDQNAMRDDGLARTFLRALVRLIGGYRDALKFQQGEKITFNDEAFVESRPPPMQPFLRELLKTQIFQQFKDHRLDILNAGLGFSDKFELEANNYIAKSHSVIHEQYSHWKKQGTAIMKTVKNKTKPAMNSAVKKVRESGKEVKSAYRDMKTRIRKDGHYADVSTSTFHRTRPLTIGSPIAANATFTKQRGASSVVTTSRSNEYVPLSSPGDDVASPPDDQSQLHSDMNLLDDLHDVIFQQTQQIQQFSLVDTSPPVDRTLKPSPSLDGSSSPQPLPPARLSRGGHTPLSRNSWSLPLESQSPIAMPSPNNPFSFNLPSPPLFYLPNPLIEGSNLGSLTQSLPSMQQPSTFPMVAPSQWFLQPAISQPLPSLHDPGNTNPFAPSGMQNLLPTSLTVSTVPYSQGNGDLIRLDSTSPTNENSLSRDSSDDSIKFKEGITNPLYPYTTITTNKESQSAAQPNSVSLQQSSSGVRPKAVQTNPSQFPKVIQPTSNSRLSSPYRNNSSFVHNSARTTNSFFNENDSDLLKEYGIDFSAKTSSNNNIVQMPSDPFDLAFEAKKQNTPSTWTTFD